VGRKHIAIRMDTTNPSKGIQYFAVDHETQVSTLGCCRPKPQRLTTRLLSC